MLVVLWQICVQVNLLADVLVIAALTQASLSVEFSRRNGVVPEVHLLLPELGICCDTTDRAMRAASFAHTVFAQSLSLLFLGNEQKDVAVCRVES